MQCDFSQVDNVDVYQSIPEGSYVCRIAEVRPGLTREGSPRWGLRLEVVEGDYAGRTAGWDNLSWSERGLPRVKGVLERLGYDVSGPLEIAPDDLVGRRVRAQFQVEEHEDPTTGRRVMRLSVPFMGYEPVGEDSPF